MDTREHAGIRELADMLTALSNAILAAAIGGQWGEVDDLEQRRAELFETVPEAWDTAADAERILLAGAIEHIRVVEALTRDLLEEERRGAWLDGAAFETISEEDLARLMAGPPDTRLTC